VTPRNSCIAGEIGLDFVIPLGILVFVVFISETTVTGLEAVHTTAEDKVDIGIFFFSWKNREEVAKKRFE